MAVKRATVCWHQTGSQGDWANADSTDGNRQLLEDGFEVTVVKDATAAGQHPELGDGYAAALVNFGFIANAVVTTKEAVASLN